MKSWAEVIDMSEAEFDAWVAQSVREGREQLARSLKAAVLDQAPDPDWKEKIRAQKLVPDTIHLFLTETDLRAARAAYRGKDDGLHECSEDSETGATET